MKVVEGWADIDDVDTFLEKLSEIGTVHETAVQAFDARCIAGADHLAVAVDRATRAFDRDDAIADDLAIEILCYAAGRRQIDRAMELGVSTGRTPVAIVVQGGEETAAAEEIRTQIDVEPVVGSERDDDRIAAYFDITAAEREATSAGLQALVIERVSLLAVDK